MQIKIPLPKTLENCETERLKFRKLETTDIEELMPFFNSEIAMEFLPVSSIIPAENAPIWIHRQKNRYKTNGDGLYALIHKETGKIVGMCGLIIQDVDDKKELEIGYHLLPQYWKNGFATEAAGFCKSFVRENKLAGSVISLIDLHNINSQKVAERNGLERQKQTVFKNIAAYIYRINL
ncbi:MAG: N-acetyltransferase [Sphingobacteriales bacterium]|nr:MAG: N-acetyltransferase [Sphingobacteriales bacterium]